MARHPLDCTRPLVALLDATQADANCMVKIHLEQAGACRPVSAAPTARVR
jgi:hypothetical protein